MQRGDFVDAIRTNRIRITMEGDRLTVVLNDDEVIANAQLPSVPLKGRIALQNHGDPVRFKL